MKKKIKKRPILVVMYASYILMTLAGLLLIYRVLKISNVENGNIVFLNEAMLMTSIDR